MTGEPSEQTDLWNTLGPYWLVGVMAATFVLLIGAVVDAMDDQPPRTVVLRLLRRLAYALVWPVSPPVYLAVALHRDRW